MKTRLSLRTRLNLLIGLAMIPIVGVGFLFAIHNARESVKNEAQSTVSLALQLVEASLKSSQENGNSVSSWMGHLGRLDKIRHLRISTLGPSSSTLNYNTVKLHSRARIPEWFTWAVAPEPIRVERMFQDEQQQPVTILIEGNADDEIAETWIETRGFLVLLLVLAGAVYALVHIIVGRAFRPVDIILDGLEKIEQGAFDKRLPEFPLPEFNRIAGAFNHMACNLERSRKENRALVRHSMQIQEEERRFLARELHDELGQSLTAIKVMAAALKARQENPIDGPAHQIIGICDQLFSVIRTMMRRLRPSMLDELGLAASLEDLVENWKSSHPELGIHLCCSPDIDETCADSSIEVFRIVQECLTNIIKHAEARRVEIGLHKEETDTGSSLVLRISDDGCGFDQAQSKGGFGLYGIRERVAGMNGELSITTHPGQGVAIKICVPATSSLPHE